MAGFSSALFILGLSSVPVVEVPPVYLCATPTIYPALSGTGMAYSKLDGTSTSYPALDGTPDMVDCD